MNKSTTRISNIRCRPTHSNSFSLTISLTGPIPEKLDYLKELNVVRDIVAAFGLKFRQKLKIVTTRIVSRLKTISIIVLEVEKIIPNFEDLPFFGLNHTGNSDISKKLRATNFTDAAIVAAEFAITNQLAGVTAFYKQGNHEGMVCIVNTNIYQKLSSSDKRVEKFIGTTKCLLLKGFY